MNLSSEHREQRANRLIAGYERLGDVPDELFDVHGNIRPVWQGFLDYLGRFSDDDLTRRLARGDQYLKDAGVFFRQYGEDAAVERDWPLSHIPVLIHEAEWQALGEGLIQRAELLERIVADLYGDNRLIAEGLLPPALIAGNPEWLRPLVGVKPASGHYLSFVAFDIGRGPDGTWWVMGDRTQAPSGAGFALENRVATSRSFADYFAKAQVHRLAGFFRHFRDTLNQMRINKDTRVAILTPGLLNDTYFEHAYIARYLGFSLLEGEDLVVEDGVLKVRTIDGARPLSVVWRRLDASYTDPLELDEHSQLGTPGLLGAVRSGSVSVVNALGTGVLESRALMAFYPEIGLHLLGEPLKLPNIATWWCGPREQRDYVRGNLSRLVVGPALSTRLPFEFGNDTAVGGRFLDGSARDIDSWIEENGPSLVGQEAVSLSTTPAFSGGRLVARPLSLRIFLARTSNGWEVMPGGFARIGRSPDPAAIAMQRGGSVADVWIVSDNPVSVETMLPTDKEPYTRPQPGILPSRAADNLYWLGRYVERAENIMRLLRAYHLRLAESANEDLPIIRNLTLYLHMLKIDPKVPVPEPLLATIRSAINSALRIRDRFSVDGWTALNELSRTAGRFAAYVSPGDDAAHAYGEMLRRITAFSGLVHENMYRFSGWRFLTIGRSLERADAMASVLAWFADATAPEGALDLAVEFGDSVMTHRRRYAVATNRNNAIDLLVLDALNPRSILYQIGEIKTHVSALPRIGEEAQMTPLERFVLKLHTGIAIRMPSDLKATDFLNVRNDLGAISDLLSETYLG
ncbi:MAG: circularly permuted type 2 ATP-grasp protein [Rhodobiaceae bacterium]|nr:circularly permuted type 2 ATP-grasp protein [Rhodobiaceae bacterium]